MSLVAAIYNTVLGMRKRTWASGMTVRKNEIVKSPADNEDYERVTATGAGTTDPADDTTNYVARSYTRVLSLPATNSIVGSNSVLGFTKTNFSLTMAAGRTKITEINGRGQLSLFIVCPMSASTIRTEILCDGRSVYDYTVANPSVSFSSINVGSLISSSTGYTLLPVNNPAVFRRSLQIYMTATVANTEGGSYYGHNISLES